MIRLQTAKGRDIPNNQIAEISAFERNYSAELEKRFHKARFFGGTSGQYNCHDLTFASRRARIWELPIVVQVLEDDGFREIEIVHTRPGDVIVYFTDDGEPSHSGIVTRNDGEVRVPFVWSKWGSGPEVEHLLPDVPNQYGTTHRAYRCQP